MINPLSELWQKTTPEERSKLMKKLRATGNPNRWYNLTQEQKRQRALKMVLAKKLKRSKQEVRNDIQKAIKLGGLK